MPDGFLMDLALVALLILIGGFFAASEIALITVKRHRLHQLVSEGNRSARIAERVTSDPSRFLATIQIAITFLGFLASAVGAVSLSGSLAGLIGLIPIDFVQSAADEISFVIITLLIALASIIIGELVPKTLALTFAERFALVVARPIGWMDAVLRPVVWLVASVSERAGARARRSGSAPGRLPLDRGAEDAGRDRQRDGRDRGGREGDDPRGHRAGRDQGPRGDGAAHRHPGRGRQ